MKVAAIITEYNPFHCGHAYQLSQIKADFVMVIMSGNYVQRGEPALIDKQIRTEMALAGGIDLVLELPLAAAIGSAEYFAKGAVYLLTQSRVVDCLYFGAEHSEINDLQAIAEILLNESLEFSVLLQNSLKHGNSFASARQDAIEALYPHTPYAEILKGSNNILAIEYLKALRSDQSPIIPYLVPRQGQAYLDSTYRPDLIMSATAIRRLLADPQFSAIHPDNCNFSAPGDSLLAADRQFEVSPQPFENSFYQKLSSALSQALPLSSYEILSHAIAQKKGPIYPADIYPFLRMTLLQSDPEELLKIREINSDLLNRLLNGLTQNLDFEDYIRFCSARNFPAARVKRALLYIFLKQFQPQPLTAENSYLKILGFRRSAAPLLRKLQENAVLPVLTNTRHTKKLSSAAYTNYQAELKADKIYAEILRHKYQTILPLPEQNNPIIYP